MSAFRDRPAAEVLADQWVMDGMVKALDTDYLNGLHRVHATVEQAGPDATIGLIFDRLGIKEDAEGVRQLEQDRFDRAFETARRMGRVRPEERDEIEHLRTLDSNATIKHLEGPPPGVSPKAWMLDQQVQTYMHLHDMPAGEYAEALHAVEAQGGAAVEKETT